MKTVLTPAQRADRISLAVESYMDVEDAEFRANLNKDILAAIEVAIEDEREACAKAAGLEPAVRAYAERARDKDGACCAYAMLGQVDRIQAAIRARKT